MAEKGLGNMFRRSIGIWAILLNRKKVSDLES